ncbi:hypothetical protein [Amycolatopsis tolypomycina]|uniref:hypothetical protein n=1 Tax=Amycolatopsis tolypomycina TaxID=208445 RepID=UPI0033B97942
MRVTDLPLPRAIATRPRDPDTGSWVPAITHWRNGVPAWGEVSGERQLLCALQRRCGVCGRRFADDETEWHVVGRRTAVLIDYALRRGGELARPVMTREVPAHEICAVFSVLACPFLASPNARRRRDGDGLNADAQAGTRRGTGAALAGFAPYRLKVTPQRPDLIFALELVRPRQVRHYNLGIELLGHLRQLVAADGEPREPDPPFLGVDDEAAVLELQRTLREDRDGGAVRRPVRGQMPG